MDAPSTLPVFAISDQANTQEPIDALKFNGYPDGAYPSAKNWNWFAKWTSRWIAYFQEKVAELLSKMSTPVDSFTFFPATSPAQSIAGCCLCKTGKIVSVILRDAFFAANTLSLSYGTITMTSSTLPVGLAPTGVSTYGHIWVYEGTTIFPCNILVTSSHTNALDISISKIDGGAFDSTKEISFSNTGLMYFLP